MRQLEKFKHQVDLEWHQEITVWFFFRCGNSILVIFLKFLSFRVLHKMLTDDMM